MHEAGYCEALLPVVDARARGRPVQGIGIRAGVRHGLMGEVLQMAWQMVADGTAYADATTHLEPALMAATCRDCGRTYETDDTLSQCPDCSAMGARLAGGDEFGLAWLSFADADAREAGTDEQIDVDMSGHTHDDDDHAHDDRHHGGG